MLLLCTLPFPEKIPIVKFLHELAPICRNRQRYHVRLLINAYTYTCMKTGTKVGLAIAYTLLLCFLVVVAALLMGAAAGSTSGQSTVNFLAFFVFSLFASFAGAWIYVFLTHESNRYLKIVSGLLLASPAVVVFISVVLATASSVPAVASGGNSNTVSPRASDRTMFLRDATIELPNGWSLELTDAETFDGGLAGTFFDSQKKQVGMFKQPEQSLEFAQTIRQGVIRTAQGKDIQKAVFYYGDGATVDRSRYAISYMYSDDILFHAFQLVVDGDHEADADKMMESVLFK